MAKRYCQVVPARKKTIELSDCDRTITQQPNNLATESAEVGKRGKMWLELGENLSLIKFKPTRANPSQVGGQAIPNSIQVENLARVSLSWEYRSLARALRRSFVPYAHHFRSYAFPVKVMCGRPDRFWWACSCRSWSSPSSHSCRTSDKRSRSQWKSQWTRRK